MKTNRFRVAFSYAREKRDFVAKIATILANRFGEKAILYDQYHPAEFARGDFDLELPPLYDRESDLLVTMICADYHKKEWCGLPWVALHPVLKSRNDDELILARFDLADFPGIYDTGFFDLDDH